MARFNQNYSMGQQLGQWIYENVDDDLDPKDLSQVADEMLGDNLDTRQGMDTRAGIQAGYYTKFEEDDEEEEEEDETS